MKKNLLHTIILTAALAVILTGCAKAADTGSAKNAQSVSNSVSVNTDAAEAVALANTVSDSSALFTERDLTQTADTSDAQALTVLDGSVLEITEAGVYVITGSASDCTIRIDAPDDAKVQIVLDGVSITNSDAPAIYAVNADKVFVTTTDTENSLTVTGAFTADGETNTDAVIFAKCDLVCNGTGSLQIVSAQGNGITGKDDLKFTGGTYTVQAYLDAVEANDTILISDGTFDLTAAKDGLHCENDEGEGAITITGGSFSVNANDDGIQATTVLTIDGGEFTVNAAEGMEATNVVINGGTISISASDDGINASAKSSAYEVAVTVNGGELTIIMAQGDTDGIDSNGSIYINGGTINITAPCVSFDYDRTAEYNGGTIIVNGQQLSEIPAEQMGGGRMGGFGGEFGGQAGGGRGGRSGGFVGSDRMM